MNGEQKPGENTPQSENSTSPPVAPHLNPAPIGQPEAAEQFSNVEQRMSDFERSTLRLARYGLGITILTGMFIALQWYEMHSGAGDTHTLAESAKATADSAKKQAEDATAQLTIAGQQATAMQDQVDAIKRQMRQDQRAWISIKFGDIGWDDGKPLKVQMILANPGKTPAKKLHGGSVVEKVMIGGKPHFGKLEAHFFCWIVDS